MIDTLVIDGTDMILLIDMMMMMMNIVMNRNGSYVVRLREGGGDTSSYS
jgi:hypothetical protein